MARNLRPIYGADEPVAGDRIAQALQGALGAYDQHQQQGTAEENRRRAAGQVMTTQGEGEMDRLRSLGRRLLRRPDEATVTPPPAFTPPVATAQVNSPPIGTSRAPTATPSPMVPGLPGLPQALPGITQTPSYPTPTPRAAPQPSSLRPHTIGSALDAYTENDNFGNQWTVDPNRDLNRQLALRNAEGAQDDERKEALSGKHDDEKIEALTAAGMPAAEARARVLNNVVRYDETFGQQVRGNSVSQKDWVARENLRQQHRLDMERAHASGKITSQQLQQERIALERERMDDMRAQAAERAQSGDVTRATTIAGAIDRTIPKDGVTLATQNDQQKAATAKATKDRDATLADATARNKRLTNSHATREQASARATALRAAGKTPDQIRATMQAEGYKIQ